MKDIYAPSMHDPVYQGAQGNESVVEGKIELNGLQQDDQIRLFNLPGGICINALQLVGSELNEGSRLKFICQPQQQEGESFTLLSWTLLTLSVNSDAMATVFPVLPRLIDEPGATLLVRADEGSSITGNLSVLVRYTVIGY